MTLDNNNSNLMSVLFGASHFCCLSSSTWNRLLSLDKCGVFSMAEMNDDGRTSFTLGLTTL